MSGISTEESKQKRYGIILGNILKQSQWIFLGKVFFVIVGFISNTILARILGPSLLGRYQLGLTVVLIATVFTVMGVDRGLVRFMPNLIKKNRYETRKLFIFSIQIALILCIVLIIILYLLAPALALHYFHSIEMTKVIRVFLFYLPVLSVFNVASGAVIGIKRADVNSNIVNVCLPLFFIFFLFIIYLMNLDIMGCILARIFSSMIGALVLLIFILNNLSGSDQTKERFVNRRRFLLFSKDVMLIALVYFFLGHMDIIMLGYFLPEREVGIYSVALKLSIFVLFGLQIANPIVRPYFSELSEMKDFETIEVIFKILTKWLTYSGLFIFGLIVILRFEVLNLFGAEFVSGSIILVVLSIGNLMNVIPGPTGQLLVMTDKQKWEMTNSIAIVVLNFFLNLILIPRIGPIGAAIATAFSIFSVNLIKLVEVFLLYRINPYSIKYLKGICAVFLGCIACFFVRNGTTEVGMCFVSIIFIATLTFTSVTFASMWLMGFDTEDKMLINLVRNR